MPHEKSMDISRRRFLRQLTVLSGTPLLISFPVWANTPLVWVTVGAADSFVKGTWKKIVLPEKQHKAVIYIHHADDDTFLALSARCTHKGCEVEWDGDDHQFICPCHNGRFDSQGKRTGGPPRKPLVVYLTKIDESSQLWVQI